MEKDPKSKNEKRIAELEELLSELNADSQIALGEIMFGAQSKSLRSRINQKMKGVKAINDPELTLIRTLRFMLDQGYDLLKATKDEDGFVASFPKKGKD